eukprot:9646240-Prorocentrum_lima.AAC.1
MVHIPTDFTIVGAQEHDSTAIDGETRVFRSRRFAISMLKCGGPVVGQVVPISITWTESTYAF